MKTRRSRVVALIHMVWIGLLVAFTNGCTTMELTPQGKISMGGLYHPVAGEQAIEIAGDISDKEYCATTLALKGKEGEDCVAHLKEVRYYRYGGRVFYRQEANWGTAARVAHAFRNDGPPRGGQPLMYAAPSSPTPAPQSAPPTTVVVQSGGGGGDEALKKRVDAVEKKADRAGKTARLARDGLVDHLCSDTSGPKPPSCP